MMALISSLGGRTLGDYLESVADTIMGKWRGFTDRYRAEESRMNHFGRLEVAEEMLRGCPMELERISKEGAVLVWRMKGGSWIRFRYSGTEPKLKIYYNLFVGEGGDGWVEGLRAGFGRAVVP